jgi:hypothetical protein
MLESNPPRNSRLQTHRDDGRGGDAEMLRPRLAASGHRIDRFAHASENSKYDSDAAAARCCNQSLAPQVSTSGDGVFASCENNPVGIYPTLNPIRKLLAKAWGVPPYKLGALRRTYKETKPP